jgi:hypothetical protein
MPVFLPERIPVLIVALETDFAAGTTSLAQTEDVPVAATAVFCSFALVLAAKLPKPEQ